MSEKQVAKMDISKIDKNFVVETELNLPDVVFYDVKENPFCLHTPRTRCM